MRLLIPTVFLASAAGVIFGIVSYMKAHEPAKRNPAQSAGGNSGSSVRKIQPEDDLPLPPPEPDESTPIAPLPDPPAQTDPSSIPNNKPSPASAALKVLEDFLNATTLAERLPLMEGRTPQAELEASCLAKPLPERLQLQPSMQVANTIESNNTIENFTNYVFKVTFAKSKGAKESFDLLVRQRGNQVPKVVTDPFLDLFGGRLREFAAHPGDGKQGTFQVLVSAFNTCNDNTVPNYEKKLTLKLIGEPTGKEIVTAYAGKASVIGDMLNNDQSGLSWGRPKACTIILNWNTRDNPARPYIEASTIKALNWNP